MPPTPVDGIFLDMYGTLTAGDRAAVESVCAHVIADANLDVTAREFSIEWGERFFTLMDAANDDGFVTLFDAEAQSLDMTLRARGVELDPLPYIRQLTAYWRQPPLQPEALAFLEACPAPICIVSNADDDDLRAALDHHNVRIATIVTSQQTRSYKPHTGIFEQALNQTGWARERVIHIGDSLHSDVGGARAAGLRSGWINREHRIHDIGTHEPDVEFGALTEINAWLSDCL